MDQVLTFLPQKSQLSQLPKAPGVYKMLDESGDVLYVGKAKVLRQRVRSYFATHPHPDLKTRFLVSHIAIVEVIVTSSEHHALVLENQLIKTFRPRYNIALKDDKQYPYIKITSDAYPRVLMVRDRKKDGGRYFGPYASFGSAKTLLRHIHDLFPFRDCKQSIDSVLPQPKCINMDIGKCLGPCVIKTEKASYDRLVSELTLLLTGKNQQLLTDLHGLMMAASEAQAYEKAAVFRDRYQKLSRLVEQKLITVADGDNCQVWVSHESDGIRYLLVQTFMNGILVYQRGFYQEMDRAVSEDSESALVFYQQSFFGFLDSEESVPDEVVFSSELGEALAPVIKAEGLTISVSIPQKGEKKAWVDLAKRNAGLAVLRLSQKRQLPQAGVPQDLAELIQDRFGLGHPASVIFGFDISHLGGQDIVASAVCIRDGLIEKKSYRRFKIRMVKTLSNDPLSMYEVVKRRLALCQKEGEEWPDLVLVDGGLGQLNFAKKALDELGLSDQVALLSLAKREELVYQVGVDQPVKLEQRDPILRCFQLVRDESHRFANTFQRTQRQKGLKSVLLSIPGLGVKRVNALYQQYKTLDNIAEAPVESLAMVGRIGRRLAEEIKRELSE